MSKPPSITFSANTKIKSADMNTVLNDVSTNILGYAESASDQTGITSIVDVTSLSLTFTVPSGGHYIRLFAHLTLLCATANNVAQVLFREGASTLRSYYANIGTANKEFLLFAGYTFIPASGSHTYKMSLVSATGNAMSTSASVANQPQYMSAEIL